MLDMLFVRDFVKCSGGHLKFYSYLRHTAASGIINPVLYQTPASRATPDNIFNEFEGETTETLGAFPAYFIAGEDWFILDNASINLTKAPVINLIQDLRHARPEAPLFACLRRPALRICVSEAVADAARDYANGEVHVITNGVEVSPLLPRRTFDAPPIVLIAGLKNPSLAHKIAARLNALAEIDLLVTSLPRELFLTRVAGASICVMLPLEQEGFFLPPLEAMALGRGVVTPNCGGNLAYCLPGRNCLMPPYNSDTLAEAVLALLRNKALLTEIAAFGMSTAAQYTIDRERTAYQTLLTDHFGHLV